MNDDDDNKNKSRGNVINIQKFDPKQVNEFTKEEMPYTQICNKVINECMNPVAGFIWIYLQSKPPTWKPCKKEIMKRFDISERTYQRHMSYLNSTNLIEHYTARNNDGTIDTWGIKVLNGSRFNPSVDNYKGVSYSVLINHTAKNGVVDKPAPDKGSIHTAKNGVVDFIHTAKKPHSGEMATYINKDITTTKEISHTQGEFFLEETLFLDSEQQRKAIVMRKLCLKDEKAIAKHAALNTDKTFVEVLDECVSHYATQQQPQLVSPQRLQTWINREVRFNQQQTMNKPAQKYQSAEDRAANEQKIREREMKAQTDKQAEIAASKGFKAVIRRSKQEIEAELEAERIKLGMTKSEHAAYVLSQPRKVQE